MRVSLRRLELVLKCPSSQLSIAARHARMAARQARMARSWSDFNACQPAATAPSIQSGVDSGVVAAEPTITRLSTLASCARRAGDVPDAKPPLLYFTFRHHTAYALSNSGRICGCTLLACIRTCSTRSLIDRLARSPTGPLV